VGCKDKKKERRDKIVERFVNRLKDSLDSIKELAIIYTCMVIIVAVLFSLFEGKDFGVSLWWTFITGLTIGYGDVYPITVAGRVLAVLWAHIMVFIYIPVAVGYVVVNMIKNKDAWTDEEQKEMLSLLRRATKEDK
jgi:voltage-gated potassium channel